MSYETKAKIEMAVVITMIIALFTLPLMLMSMGN
jgi:hypothetical protein